MASLRRLWEGRRARRNRARREIDDEIDAHLAARVEHLVAQGLNPEAARAEARRRFGDVDAARAALHAQATGSRTPMNVARSLDTLRQELRYVVRGLGRSPGFTAGVVATLALGLGINVAVFRVADQVLLRPPTGVVDAYAVRAVASSVVFGRGEPMRATAFSYRDASAMVESGAFGLAAISTAPRVMTRGDGRDLVVSAVDGRYFPMLGVTPSAGRLFDAREAAPGAGIPVAVVSDDYFRREMTGHFDGRAAITIGGRAHDVIGVAARGFTGVDLEPVEVWIPFGVAELGHGVVNGVTIPWYRMDMLRGLRVMGRPRPGTPDTAVAERLGVALATIDRLEGRPERSATVQSIVPVGRDARDPAPRRLLGQLTLVAAAVLLIAGANATNLLLARGLRRHREIAIRMAIGASRAHIVRLLVAESVTLAIVGAAAAVLCGYWTADALRRLVFPDARWHATAFDERTLIFAAVVALGAGLAAGLAPALQSTSPNLISGLKGDRRPGGLRSRATRAGLIMTQTALSLTLLIASGLLVKSLAQLNRVDLGFDPDGLVTASVSGTSVLRGLAGADGAAAAETMSERARASGVIDAVATASVAPFGATSMVDIRVPGSTYTPESDRDQPLVSIVSDTYFHVMRMALVEGRGFDTRPPGDLEPVAVVNASMSRRYWPDGIPPGACILPMGRSCARVIGVVNDVRDAPGGTAAPMRFYLPLDADSREATVVIARTDAARAPAAAAILRDAGPAGARVTIDIVADRVARALRPWRTATLLFLGLGLVAVALSCIGVYSVLNYVASERRHELGVRAVLGATGRDLHRLVLGEGLRWTLAGGALGLLAAAVTSRAMSSLLFEVSPHDPVVYGVAFFSLTLAAIVAMLPPARRAARVDPLVSTRQP